MLRIRRALHFPGYRLCRYARAARLCCAYGALTRKHGELPMSPSPLWTLSKNDVLYEDEHIIVINKPSGIPSQATVDPNRDHAFAAVERYLHGQYVGLHHRLDAGTSGVLLMTKSRDANPSISEQFQNHTVQKTYCALACGTEFDHEKLNLEHAFTLDAPIGEDKTSKIQKFVVGGKNRKFAKTRIECTALYQLRDGWFAQCLCQPLTGRTHQIRVHLLSLGLPIVGDTLYNPGTLRSLRAFAPDRLCLHAQTLEFIHPITGQPMTITAPVPKAFEKLTQNAKNIALKN